MGHISPEREKSLLAAGSFAAETHTPVVVDLVGVSATQLRYELGHQLLANHPNVVKGNISEMRRFSGLKSTGRGVDGSQLDQSPAAFSELAEALKQLTRRFPATTFWQPGKQTWWSALMASGAWKMASCNWIASREPVILLVL